MIILPDRNIPRTKILMPVSDKVWRTPSLSLPKDQFGNDIKKTIFYINAKSNDGIIIWSGCFEDRSDFDAFIYAIVSGTLKYEKELWDLPTPNWQPYLGELITYEFLTTTFLTSAGSLQTYSKPIDWNNDNNSIEALGAGGSGGAVWSGNQLWQSSGAGGGGYSKVSNQTISGSVSYQIGSGGNSKTTDTTNGDNGGSTWFGASTYGSAICGAVGGNGGIYASSGSCPGGSGGSSSSGIGSTKYSGGNGGTINNNDQNNATGGGGAAGKNGNGGSGGDITYNSYGASDGGTGDNNSGGTGGSGVSTPGSSALVAGNGGNGTEWSASYGSGGGGGGCARYSGNVGGNCTAGNGGLYGGGGGGVTSGTGSGFISGSGAQGLIVVQYEPAFKLLFNMPMLGM